MPRTLLITSVLPWPLHRNGGAQRTALLRRALQELGHDVDVLGVLPDLGDALPGREELAAAGVIDVLPVSIQLDPSTARSKLPGPLARLADLRRLWSHRYAARPRVVAWLDSRLKDYDRLYVRYLQTALLCGLDERPKDLRDRCRIDLDDVDWLTLQSRFAAQPWGGLAGRLGMWQTLRQVRRRCQTALTKFPTPFVASDEDAAVLSDAVVLPNVPFDAGEPLPASDPASRVVLFVGDLAFPPNRQGLIRFVLKAWPNVLREVPDARLRIVGRGLDEEIRNMAAFGSGVEAVGFAEDLRAEYAGAAMTVAPVWWGGGTKIKVVESAAMGRACAASKTATRGFAKLVGHGVTSAVDEGMLAGDVIEMLSKVEQRRAAEAAGPRAAADHYSFAAILAALRMADEGIPAGRCKI